MQNSLNIADFLPKYPYIENINDSHTHTSDLLAYNDISFEQAIFNKKEFYENRLETIETKPTTKGDLMKHQRIVARYMSIVTPYDGLLLFHAMGSGKACSAIGIAEELLYRSSMTDATQINGKIKGIIFIARGPNILNNIAKELVYVCTDGKYIPDDLDRIKPEMRAAKIRRHLAPFYKFFTIDKFIKTINSLSKDDIIKRFSNYAFCFDEVHNLRVKDMNPKNPANSDYTIIHKFLHLIENKKVILMSGTPMADAPSEIADVMNLILPRDQQMPRGDHFDNTFLIQDPEEPLIYNINRSNVDLLKSFFKGRISYLKSIVADIDITYEGTTLGLLNNFTIYIDDMVVDSIQNISYLQAYAQDSQKFSLQNIQISTILSDEENVLDTEPTKNIATGITGLFHNSQQAAVFVFPDGSYGSVGFKRYITETTTSNVFNMLTGATQHTEFKITRQPIDAERKILESLEMFINKEGPDKKLDQLAKLSIKFANVIRLLQDNKKSKRSSFVYCNWVKGSGLIVFALILEIFGYSRASGGETTPKPRYALLTSAVATENQISSFIDTFNKPENVYGEIINVVIGSKIISEGVTLKNVQDIHILTPHWNFTVTEQALSRAIRAFSHDTLRDANHKNKINKPIEVKVYLHTVIPAIQEPNGDWVHELDESIDLKMYEKSEAKDISIKRIENVIKQSAFDCALNYKRNKRDGREDYSRDCDYNECQYTCDGIDKYELTKSELDLSTYRLYYQSERINNFVSILKKLFLEYFIISYSQLLHQHSSYYSEFEILSALNKLINNSIPVYNKYGFLCYIQNFNNFYFLVNNLGIDNAATPQQYYTKYPPINSPLTFNSLVGKLRTTNFPNIIQKICTIPFVMPTNPNFTINEQSRISLFNKLPLEIQEQFLEAAYISKNTLHSTSTPLADWIIQLTNLYIVSSPSNPSIITSLLLASTNTFRVYDASTTSWSNADAEQTKNCITTITNIFEFQEKSPYGYYGIESYDKFYIKETQQQSAQKKGRDCTTIQIWQLYYIILKFNAIMLTDITIHNEPSFQEIKNSLEASPHFRTLHENINRNDPKFGTNMLSKNYKNGLYMIYLYILNKIQKPKICEDIKHFLHQHHYIVGYYLTTKNFKTDPVPIEKQKRKKPTIAPRK